MAHVNFQNRTLFHGDNLKFLRGINSGTIHLIATDPPFNKSKDFHATPDSLADGARFSDRWKWDRDVHPDWVDAIQDDWPAVWHVIEAARVASGDDMAAFLCWLGVRLLEMHRVLRDDGSIYLHIDHTAHGWVKALMDGIFGRKQFRNELIWSYKYGGRSRKAFGRKHDTILYYACSDATPFYESSVRIPHEPKSIADNFNKVDEHGRRYREGTWSSGKTYRYYADEGRLCDDVWSDINALHWTDKQRTGYPTQKPLALYERIIKASSNPGDIVLDPFAGCATTPIAAERLGRQWIGMDIWDGAQKVMLERLEAEGLTVNGNNGDHLVSLGDVHYSNAAPVRSDEEEVAAPPLTLKSRRIAEPPGPRLTRAEMKGILIEDFGIVCRGCDRVFDDDRYLEIDHNTPRADGGINHITNRLLLCGPCNRVKSNRLTLSLLREHNIRHGLMAPPPSR